MTTVIFIHGTGVRGPQYDATFKQIQKALQPKHSKRSDLNVVPCLWGETYGTKLNAGGASIPPENLGIGDTELEDTEIVLWELLYRDPLCELRLLSPEPTNIDFATLINRKENPGHKLGSHVNNLVTNLEVKKKLEEFGITEIFTEAHQRITLSEPYNNLLKDASEPLGKYRYVIARALIAQTIMDCEQKNKYSLILTNAELRDELIELLSKELMESELGLESGLFRIGISIAEIGFSLATDPIRKNRRAITTHPASFMPCDILLYQGRGEQIRAFIRDTIKQAQPPVVLLAHSLGGIACVDLLVKETLPQVELLVTVGSQAPFLYEINALQSLAYGESLPKHFPEWLNIFDKRDFLSYIGANVFPDKVHDELVDNKQPFWRSHTSYWTNKSTWDAIIWRLP